MPVNNRLYQITLINTTMSEFIGIGDLHLSSINGYGGFSRFVENSDKYILSEVQRVVNYGLDNGINTFFIYGDICDSPRMSYAAHLELRSFFIKNKQCDFHLILGNHDKLAVEANIGHSLEIFSQFKLKNVHIHVEPEVVDFGDCKVNFLSFPYCNFKKGMLNVCHLDLNGAKTDNGRTVKGKVDGAGYDIVSGHIHSSGDYKRIHYSGTLYQLNFGESVNRKGFHRIECVGSEVEVQFIPFKPKYELCDLEISKNTVIPKNNVNKLYRLMVVEEIDPALYASLNVVSIKHCSKEEFAQLDLKFEQLDLDPESVLDTFLADLSKEEAARIKECRSRYLYK